MNFEIGIYLDDAIATGKDQGAIDKARSKHEAANQHFVMIRDEKRKNWLKNFLKGMLLITLATTLTESTKQVKEGAQQTAPQ
ncbi:MAG: hypothetical protein HY426_03890 [Candidatus Levybacteria bacterium]|nr:hypothetical protein [Candidatus Levybacteria bacterium]